MAFLEGRLLRREHARVGVYRPVKEHCLPSRPCEASRRWSGFDRGGGPGNWRLVVVVDLTESGEGHIGDLTLPLQM